MDAKYNEDGEVHLKKSIFRNEEYCKYIVFHELTHAITTTRDSQGNEIQSGFLNKENHLGVGFNEAMTEWMSQVRNNAFEPNSQNLQSDYRTIVSQIEKIALIIGKENLINCFLHNPENFKQLLEERKMDYFQLNNSFNYLLGKDSDVYNMSNKKTLLDTSNYRIAKYAKLSYNNFDKAVGEVNTLEDFYKKYSILNYTKTDQYNPIKAITLNHYCNMGKDIDNLLKNGIKIQQIKEELQKIGIDFNILNNTYAFSKCFVSDKNQTAINIYDFYSKYPQIYYNIFAQNYGEMYTHFHEFDINPKEDELYNMTLYPIMGKFLKEHSDLDYSEISYITISEKNTNSNIYLFYDSQGRRYMYNENGKPAIYKREQNGDAYSTAISQDIHLKFFLNDDQTIHYSVNAKQGIDIEEFMENFSLKFSDYKYSDKEELEYHINQGNDTNGDLKRKLNTITKRMEKRAYSFSDGHEDR